MPTSRERVETALAHREPDLVPLDLGAMPVTGMHVDSVYLLRQALGLDAPGTPVKVAEPYQMLGEIQPDLMDALGVDVVGIGGPTNFYGFPNEDWKEWRTFDGTPVLVPGLFCTDPEPGTGDILMYPQGDRSVPASARMPNGGFYFDAIIRQEPLAGKVLDPRENLEEFTLIDEAGLQHIRREAEKWAATGKAVALVIGDTGFGDIAFVPGLKLKDPRGIRDVQEWYMSLASRREYLHAIFDAQCEVGVQNLRNIHAVAGDLISVVYVSGTDFGAQDRPFIAPRMFRELFKPYHARVNEWIHANTTWKSFIHTDGAIFKLLDDLAESGFDILNPVQTSATGMDPVLIKETYGDRLSFWGAGVETQTTLPFGTPQEVREEVKQRLDIFGKGGGYVFASIHNVQTRIPVENIVAFYEAFAENRAY